MNNQSAKIKHTQDKIFECQKLIEKLREKINQEPSNVGLRTSLTLYTEYQKTMENLLRAEQQKAMKAASTECNSLALTTLPTPAFGV